MKRRVVIVLVYFGVLPNYFDLWLASCEANPEFDWAVFTDDPAHFNWPDNVHRHHMTRGQFCELMSDALNINVQFDLPYKVCDFRPAFWALLPLLRRDYDFWGHCDADMVFGDLGAFITDDILARHFKIFSVGHLTIYRNDWRANLMFASDAAGLNWRSILEDTSHRAFDEHQGVNKLWQLSDLPIFTDERCIADIDPSIERLETVFQWIPWVAECFVFRAGKVVRIRHFGIFALEREFMYIHFQKRKMRRNGVPLYSSEFAFAPDGFQPVPVVPITFRMCRLLNPLRGRQLAKEIPLRLRKIGRQVKAAL